MVGDIIIAIGEIKFPKEAASVWRPFHLRLLSLLLGTAMIIVVS